MGKEYGPEECLILGKVPSYVLLYDDFESRGKWGTVPGWGVPRPGYFDYAAYNGGKGLGLGVRIVTPNGYAKSFPGRSFGFGTWGKFTAGVSFRGRPTEAVEVFCLVFEIFHDGKKYTAGIGTEVLSGQWFFVHGYGTGDWDVIFGLSFKVDPEVWHRLELEVNFAEGRYENFSCGGRKFDISGYTPKIVADPGKDVAWVLVGCASSSVGIHGAYFDDVLVRRI